MIRDPSLGVVASPERRQLRAYTPTQVLVLLLISLGLGPTTYAATEFTAAVAEGVSMDFVWIEPGTFTMGTTETQKRLIEARDEWYTWSENQLSAHAVTITRGYWIGKHEITQGQWEAVMGTAPWSGNDNVDLNPRSPAVDITSEDLQGLVRRLNGDVGVPIYRLPTEAEWEDACRAGTSTTWSFGDEESRLGEFAWYPGNTWNVGLKTAQPVGTKLPNPLGLFDMHGWRIGIVRATTERPRSKIPKDP